jgi:Glycosyltransferases involved in cell wall biogenesis
MPIYNSAPYIKRALLSALNQDYNSIEFLLVDDKGQDDSLRIVHEIIRSHPRGKDVRIVEHPNNIGPGGVRNTGIDNAMGEYIFFMDSDDEITPDCIDTLYMAMMETQVDFVAASTEYVNQDRVVVAGNRFLEYADQVVKGGEDAVAGAWFTGHLRFGIPVWNKLYRLAFLKNYCVRCVSDHLNEDTFFTFQVVLNARSCRLLSRKTYRYFITEGSTCQMNRNRMLSQRLAQGLESIISNSAMYIDRYKIKSYYKAVAWQIFSDAIGFSHRVLLSCSLDLQIDERRRLIEKMMNSAVNVVLPVLSTRWCPLAKYIGQIQNLQTRIFLFRVFRWAVRHAVKGMVS